MKSRFVPAWSVGYGWLRPRLPYVAFAALTATCLPLESRPAIGLASIIVVYAAGVLLGIGYSIRAATHPLLDHTIRRPWKYLAAVFCLDIVIGLSLLPTNQEADPARVRMTPLLLLGIVGLVAQSGCLVTALVSFASVPLAGRARRKLAMDVLIVAGAALILLWYFLIWPAVSGHGLSLSPAAMLYDCAMLLSDLASIVGISTVLLRGTLASVRLPARLALTNVVGCLGWDLWTIWAQLHRTLDLSAAASQLMVTVPLFFMVAAAVEQCRLATRDPPPMPPPLGVQRPSPLPYLALMIGFGVQVAAALRSGGLLWLGLVAGGVVMTFGAAMRQLIALHENYDLALTDPLTGLANRARLRAALDETVSSYRRTGTATAVLVIDLNEFKLVNDTYGHETGDELLVTFAEVVRRTLRKSDVLARWGGDEFVVVLSGIQEIQDAILTAERILTEVDHPVVVKGHRISIHPSIGIAVTDPRAPDVTADSLLHGADRAMYRTKRTGRPGWRLYSRDWQAEDAGAPFSRVFDTSHIRIDH